MQLLNEQNYQGLNQTSSNIYVTTEFLMNYPYGKPYLYLPNHQLYIF